LFINQTVSTVSFIFSTFKLYYCTNFIINKNKSLYLGVNLRVDALLSGWIAAAAEQSSGNDNDDTDSTHSINELSS